VGQGATEVTSSMGTELAVKTYSSSGKPVPLWRTSKKYWSRRGVWLGLKRMA